MIAHISEDMIPREESVAEHTEKVGFLCKGKGERCGMGQIMYLCGILHDMGKNKQKFDDYIRAGQAERQRLRGKIPHASTGAKYLYSQYHGSTGNQKLLTELIAYGVAAHHGLFDCVNVEHMDLFSGKLGQVEDYEEACSNAERDYLGAYPIDQIFGEALEEFGVLCHKIQGSLGRLQGMQGARNAQEAKKEKKALLDSYFFQLSCLQRLVLSILIDADWEATSDFMGGIDTLIKQPICRPGEIFAQAEAHFNCFMEKKQEGARAGAGSKKEREIFEARNALQQECREFARHPAGIYCLPLPTGGGKTLSGLSYALEYARLHPKTERIIYVSPYISITEQNAEVFRQAVGCKEWILEHHSAVVREADWEGEDYRDRRSSRFELNWEEPLICTTFVQFMNTLFSDKSESIRRMHRLVNAVVIMDEVQSMPLRCVHTFNHMANFLNTVCHTDIILCTATQPALGEAQCPLCYSEPKYMVQDVEKWFRIFERVKIRVPQIGETYTIESLGEEIVDQAGQYRSILVVLNTKSAVKKLYELLKQQGINTAYLTTNLCAQHRSDRIRTIKQALQEGQPMVVVSTNLIEAGVDISFEYVYRSMAGLDSLAQSAGRCNRNGELEEGTVSLIRLEGENTGSMSELLDNRRKAEDVLDDYQNSKNPGSLLLPEWMECYYRKVYQGAADKMNFPIPDLETNLVELLSMGFSTERRLNTMNQAYKTAGQAYRVIDEDSFGVIVPYEEGERIIASIQNASDPGEIKGQIRNAQRYTVNVRSSQRRKLEGLIQPVSDQFPDIYMIAAPGAYQEDCGITEQWEPLIL